MKLNIPPLSQKDLEVWYNKVWLIILVRSVGRIFSDLGTKSINFVRELAMGSQRENPQLKENVRPVGSNSLSLIKLLNGGIALVNVPINHILRVLRGSVLLVVKSSLRGRAKEENIVLQNASIREILESLKDIPGQNTRKFTLRGRELFGNIGMLWKKILVENLNHGNRFITLMEIPRIMTLKI